MELFLDGAHLRLRARTRAHDTMYLHAEEDGVGITVRRRRGTLNEVWAVHRLERDDGNYVLLHSAAYGRYFAIVLEDAPPPAPSSGQGGEEGAAAPPARHTCRAVQRDYDGPGQDDVLWEIFAADDGSDDVLMRHRTTMQWRWSVEVIPRRADPPELPPVILPPAVPVGDPIRRWHRGVQSQAVTVLRRQINYVRADDLGNFHPFVWRMLWFDGRSVSRLRRDLAAQLGVEEANVLSITLCAWAGFNGRLTPLVIDLPSNEQAMDIVVLTTGSPAAEALVHPNVGAP